MEKDAETLENLEESVFKALDHQKRRDVLRYIGETGSVTFTELKNKVDFQDSPSLSYHLKSLEPFLEQRNGKYGLSYLGKSAYSLLLKTGSYSRAAIHYSKKKNTIIGHVIIWLAALGAAVVLGVDSFYYTVIIPVLASTSFTIIYALFE